MFPKQKKLNKTEIKNKIKRNLKIAYKNIIKHFSEISENASHRHIVSFLDWYFHNFCFFVFVHLGLGEISNLSFGSQAERFGNAWFSVYVWILLISVSSTDIVV